MLKAILFIFKYFFKLNVFKEMLEDIGEKWRADTSYSRTLKSIFMGKAYLWIINALTPLVDSIVRSPYPYSENIVSASSAHGFYWYDVGSASSVHFYTKGIFSGSKIYPYSENVIVGVVAYGELG